MNYVTHFDFDNHQYDPYPWSARPTPINIGAQDLTSLSSS